MTYSKKTTHVAEGLGHLIEQFKNKEDLAKLLTVFLNQVQELEDALSDIITETTVDTSAGAQLDALGAIVGEDRAGRNDLQYSTALRARLILNVSEGTPENVIALVRGIAGDVRVHVYEHFPCSFIAMIIDPIDPSEVDFSAIGGLVGSGRPAGVQGFVTYGVAPAFRFDAGPGYDEGKYGGVATA